MELDDLLGIDGSSREVLDARDDVAEYVNLIESLVARRRATMTQADVAALLGTTQSAVSKFERVGGDARYSTLQRYARALGGRVRTRCTFEGEGTRVAFSASPVPGPSTFYRPHTAS